MSGVVTINFVFYSPGNRIADCSQATGALIREYVRLNGEPLAVIEGGVVNFVRVDHIGRPVFATNAAATKTWTASYLPFGEVRTATGTPIALRFPGQWFQSESGLHQNWMRDYDSTRSRYFDADPLGPVDRGLRPISAPIPNIGLEHVAFAPIQDSHVSRFVIP